MISIPRSFKKNAAIALAILSSQGLFAQDWKAQPVDSVFHAARKEAFSGDYPAAREKLFHIIHAHADHADARLLIARTYAWEKQYDAARREIHFVIKRDPGNTEAIETLVDVEMWSERFSEALAVIEQLLTDAPDRSELLFKKARASYEMNQNAAALAAVESVLRLAPEHHDAIQLRQQIMDESKKYSVRLATSADVFSKYYSLGRGLSAEIGRMSAWGFAALRVNIANRFESYGTQVEAEVYPKLSKRVYGYVNYAYSADELFPAHRIGVEGYVKIARSLEASAGMRSLRFTDSRAYIYTGSVTLYAGDYWVSLRPYMTPYDGHMTASGVVSVRRYFGDADSFLGISAGMGFSPDYARLQSAFGIGDAGIHSFNSQRTAISWQKRFTKSWVANLACELTRQEIGRDGGYLLITSSTVSIKKKL